MQCFWTSTNLRIAQLAIFFALVMMRSCRPRFRDGFGLDRFESASSTSRIFLQYLREGCSVAIISRNAALRRPSAIVIKRFTRQFFQYLPQNCSSTAASSLFQGGANGKLPR